MAKTEVAMTGLTIHLAKIQSIGQRLDHLALTTLPAENQARYLTECNRHLIGLEQPLSSSSGRPTPLRTEKLDQDETQIVQRSSVHRRQKNIEELSQALDKDFHQADLWLQRCLCWLARNDYAAAMSDLIRAHRLSPQNPLVQQTLRRMKMIYEQEGKNFPLTSF